jgi:flagellar biosynthesis protein FlhF
MRQAIRQVREALGADAVILSNKPVAEGVELVAAMDYDESQWSRSDTQSASETSEQNTAAETATGSKENRCRASYKLEKSDRSAEVSVKPGSSANWRQDPVLVEMRREMSVIRRMMENELSGLGWRDLGERKPGAQELLRRLISMGLTADLCRRTIDKVQVADDAEQAWRDALNRLAADLPVVESDLLEHGGVVAVIGPTGVGKTTTVAKLAARFCLRHGNRHLALISTDNFRIGAREQLHDYARILDVPVRTATNADELSAALSAFADKRLVLIDTAGVSQQDIRLGEQLSMLTSSHQRVNCFLTLSASTQHASMTLAINAFAAARPDACILTKVDETAELGGALSAVIKAGLPVAFITDGQRVPEDLQIARSHNLINQAVSMAEEDDFNQNDEYIAIALGGAVGHAHV